MPNTALITGASSGLGAEFARYHAALGGDLVITARRAEALEALKTELEAAHGVAVHVIPLDLGAAGAADALHAAVRDLGSPIDILINNAGFGLHGHLVDQDWTRVAAMIDLNISALTRLTQLFAADMAAGGGGRILNVGSTAGFMPGPNQAAYFATKAYVNSLTQAVAKEMEDRNVTCTLLAPGYVETGFAKSANLEDTNMVKAGGAKASEVVRLGYEAMMAGRLVAIDNWRLKIFINWLLPILPRRMALNMIANTQAK